MRKINKILLNSLFFLILTIPVVALAASSGKGGWNVSDVMSFGLPVSSTENIVSNVAKWILGLVGSFGVIGFCISGILYMTAAGDDDRMKTAKNAMIYSIIGILVALSSLVIWTAADTLLTGGANF